MLVGVGEASFISLAAPLIDDNAPVARPDILTTSCVPILTENIILLLFVTSRFLDLGSVAGFDILNMLLDFNLTGNPVFIDVSQRVLNVRPTTFFFIRCSLQLKEIQHMFYNAQDRYESTQQCTMSTVSMIFFQLFASEDCSNSIEPQRS